MAFETAADASEWFSSVIAYIMHHICTVHNVSWGVRGGTVG
jgi:hypothetical protein